MTSQPHGSNVTPQILPSYWHGSQQPLASLLLVLPVLLLYELGVVWLGPQALRNGADVWLGQLLDAVGVSYTWALPVLVVGVLVAWHHVARQPWRVRTGVLVGMFCECVLLALVLLLIARAQGLLFGPLQPPAPRMSASALASLPSVPACAIPTSTESPGPIARFLARFIAFCGAGVYEEVLFRLLLLPACAALVRWFGASWQTSWIVAAVVTSVVFSAAHYVGSHGEPFDFGLARFWFTCTFRAVAGLFFALLFVYRGFGIAVGTHALYDVFAGLS